jgi:transcriptional regulator with XRE-family HTH domain
MERQNAAIPRSRTLPVRGETLKNLRVKKGWPVRELAKKAGCSKETIENAERGRPVYLATLAKIARALDVAVDALLADSSDLPTPATTNPSPVRRIAFDITLRFEMADFDESNQFGSLMMQLVRRAATQSLIDINSITDGSVIIRGEMDEEDYARLLAAFREGRLADLGPKQALYIS